MHRNVLLEAERGRMEGCLSLSFTLFHIYNIRKMSAKSPKRKQIVSDVTHIVTRVLWTCCHAIVVAEGRVTDLL
jgi:hypothetical protein